MGRLFDNGYFVIGLSFVIAVGIARYLFWYPMVDELGFMLALGIMLGALIFGVSFLVIGVREERKRTLGGKG